MAVHKQFVWGSDVGVLENMPNERPSGWKLFLVGSSVESDHGFRGVVEHSEFYGCSDKSSSAAPATRDVGRIKQGVLIERDTPVTRDAGR